ncbi:hypothetical protein EG872_16140, partial [Enterococcus faecalis]
GGGGGGWGGGGEAPRRRPGTGPEPGRPDGWVAGWIGWIGWVVDQPVPLASLWGGEKTHDVSVSHDPLPFPRSLPTPAHLPTRPVPGRGRGRGEPHPGSPPTHLGDGRATPEAVLPERCGT